MGGLFRNLLPGIILLEVLLFSLIFILIGFGLKKQDPLFLKAPYSPMLILSLVFSLYYGFVGGVVFLLFASIVSLIVYKNFPIESLLFNSLFVLIASEFRYYWNRRIKAIESEAEYLQEYAESLRKELFVLKISHKQLEYNYIMRPYSIRNMIKELRERLLIEKNESSIMHFFLTILMQHFQVYSAGVFRVEKDNALLIASIGNGFSELDMEDEMVKQALEWGEPHYIPPKALSDLSSLKYLAVVVVPSGDKKYLLVIRDMLFVNLNEEFLYYAKLLMEYIVEDIEISKGMTVDEGLLPYCGFEFFKELYKTAKMREKLGVKSSIVFFKAKELSENKLSDIELSIRALDMVCVVNLKQQVFLIFLLPFTPAFNAKNFVNRMSQKFPFLEVVKLEEVEESKLKTLSEVIIDE